MLICCFLRGTYVGPNHPPGPAMPRSGPLREGSQAGLAVRGTLGSMPPEPKTCQSCGRTIEWRKKWERDWDQVRYCSTACRKRGVSDVDRRLEESILDLLAQRARTSTICPSDAARAVGDEDSWRDLMEPARRAARRLVAGLPPDGWGAWQRQVAETVNAPPFVVVRLWLDQPMDADRPAFVGTSGYGALDNVSLLERFERGAADWAREHRGSVVELHAYGCDPAVATDADAAASVVAGLEEQLHRLYPEAACAGVLQREVLVRDDCTLIGPDRGAERPGVRTPSPRLVLAGDWVRCDYPVALMERAATTGFLAANELLAGWGAAGQDVWTVPMRGLLP